MIPSDSSWFPTIPPDSSRFLYDSHRFLQIPRFLMRFLDGVDEIPGSDLPLDFCVSVMNFGCPGVSERHTLRKFIMKSFIAVATRIGARAISEISEIRVNLGQKYHFSGKIFVKQKKFLGKILFDPAPPVH